MEQEPICVICHDPIEPQRDDDGVVVWAGGNSALPVSPGRCCDLCNIFVVLPARLRDTWMPCGDDDCHLRKMEAGNDE